MASEPGARESSGQQEAQPAPPRPVSRRRRRRMLIALVVIVAALVVVFWGWSTTGGSFLDVSEVLAQPAKYVDQTIEVQGVVSDWSGDPGDLNFTLADKSDPAKAVDVTMAGTYPEGFENGKSVVVKGELSDTLPLRIVATGITVGCASKY